MTEAKAMRRGRRSSTTDIDIPVNLAAWFAGEQSRVPWSALLPPEDVLLHERWRAWKKQHPAAKPPDGYERLAEHPPERMHGLPWAEVLAEAKARYRRGIKLGVYAHRTRSV